MEISSIDKLILRDLSSRNSLNLKNSHESSSLSYRQFLRRIDDLYDKGIITGWLPVVHPLTYRVKKFVWLFLKTNPKNTQDLDYLNSLEGQLLSLDGIAGIFSLLALIQFTNDNDFNSFLAKIEEAFQVHDPVRELQRYQHLEIIAFYKFNGFPIEKDINEPSEAEIRIIQSLFEVGVHTKRPPTIEEIADVSKMSTSSVQKILKSLERSSTILGYSLRLNQIIKPAIKMIVQFKIHPRSIAEIISILKEDPHTSFLAKTQSDYSLLAIVYLDSIQNYNEWLKELYLNEDLLDTLTTVVLKDEYKEKNSLLFPIL